MEYPQANMEYLSQRPHGEFMKMKGGHCWDFYTSDADARCWRRYFPKFGVFGGIWSFYSPWVLDDIYIPFVSTSAFLVYYSSMKPNAIINLFRSALFVNSETHYILLDNYIL